MSKKLLSEAQVRRFAKLANLSPINEMDYRRDEDLEEAYGGNKGDDSETHKGEKDYTTKKGDELKHSGSGRGEKKGDEAFKNESLQEDAMEDIEDEVDAELPGGEEVEMSAGEEEISDEPSDVGNEELADKIIRNIAGVLEAELGVNIEVDGDEDDMDMDDMGDMGDEMGAEMDDEIEMQDDEEMVMEALKGINYLPGKKEIVNEVAKRVAKRLLKAKQAERDIQEALGNRRSARRKK